MTSQNLKVPNLGSSCSALLFIPFFGLQYLTVSVKELSFMIHLFLSCHYHCESSLWLRLVSLWTHEPSLKAVFSIDNCWILEIFCMASRYSTNSCPKDTSEVIWNYDYVKGVLGSGVVLCQCDWVSLLQCRAEDTNISDALKTGCSSCLQHVQCHFWLMVLSGSQDSTVEVTSTAAQDGGLVHPYPWFL